MSLGQDYEKKYEEIINSAKKDEQVGENINMILDKEAEKAGEELADLLDQGGKLN